MNIKPKISQIIEFGGRVGLPVRFLRYVLQNYDFVSEDDDRNETDTLFNKVELITSTADGLRGIERFEATSDSIDSVYHEATHAYFDLRGEANDEPVAALISRAIRYYSGAELRPPEGAPTEPVIRAKPGDLERLVEEAAGEYVGVQANRWWDARKLLQLASRPRRRDGQPRTGDEALKAVRMARAGYNRSGTERVFGYTEVGYIWRVARHTTRPIMPELKQYLDRQLLENKIPENFNSVDSFRGVLQQLSVQWRWHHGEAWRAS